MASIAYAEQVGRYRQLLPRRGEIHRRYKWINASSHHDGWYGLIVCRGSFTLGSPTISSGCNGGSKPLDYSPKLRRRQPGLTGLSDDDVGPIVIERHTRHRRAKPALDAVALHRVSDPFPGHEAHLRQARVSIGSDHDDIAAAVPTSAPIRPLERLSPSQRDVAAAAMR